MRKIFFITILILGYSVVSFAQVKKTALVKGRLIDSLTKKPLPDKRIIINSLNVFTTSDGEGRFEFSEVPYGNQVVEVSGASVIKVLVSVNVDRDVVETGDIVVRHNDQYNNPLDAENAEIPTIAIDESSANTDEEGITTQNSGGILVASRDPLINAIAFTFGAFWFQPREAQRNTEEVIVNGIPMNDAETGNASWSQTGGLNDVFHTWDVTYGLAPSPYIFGGTVGSTYFNATAADQKKETKISYQSTDRNYRNRIMFTENSGMMKNGWAYSFSFSRRWAQEGYVPGTPYDGYSYYAAVSKVIGKGQLNLTTFGAPTIRGKSSANTKEVDSLAHSNYFNHDWGYQDGKKRNYFVQNTYQPVTILNYEYRPSEKTRWNTAIGYEFGKDKSSLLHGIDASTGSTFFDYYRDLPSYFINGIVPQEPGIAQNIRTQYYNNPGLMQLNWNQLYQNNYTNIQTIHNVNGIAGNNVTGKQAIWALSNRVNDLKKFTFSSNVEHTFNENLKVDGGLTFISENTESYEQMSDLLGSDFLLDFNQYAPTTAIPNPNFLRNDLKNPNALIKVGDKFDHDYAIRDYYSILWGQVIYTLNRVEFFIAANAGNNSFYRDGYFQNGIFPNNSYGISATHSFFTYGTKGGINFKIDARNILFLNAAYTATPPTPDNTYISANTRDFAVDNPTVQINKSLEGGYFLKAKDLSIRIDGYVNDINNSTSIKRFYNDDPAYYTFVNYAMQGINTRSIGTEMAFNYQITRRFSVNGAASVGQAFYTNDPNIRLYLDNDTTQHPIPSKVFIKNYYLSAGPQSAYTIGVGHRSKGWYTNLNCNYIDRNYVEIDPNRMTTAAAGFAQAGSPLWHQIFDQEKLPSAVTVNFHVSKYFQLSRRFKFIKDNISKDATLNISLGVNNLLNNTNIINLGFEQLRYDFINGNPNKFPNKYIYGEGINYVLNIILRF